jgi:hypothetical protein
MKGDIDMKEFVFRVLNFLVDLVCAWKSMHKSKSKGTKLTKDTNTHKDDNVGGDVK